MLNLAVSQPNLCSGELLEVWQMIGWALWIFKIVIPVIIIEWCTNLSIIADAIVVSPNTSPHFEKGWFVVIIVGLFSYLLAISWKNIFASSFVIGKYPISSIINNLYLQ